MTNGFLEGERRKPGFRYAVLSDTHIKPEGGESSSPWKVNMYTNDRARWVIDRINRSAPDFIVHMGDIVHPLPHLPTYSTAAESALSILSELKATCHCIPGNHDVGDKKNPTVPAYAVDDHGLDLYKKWFGPLYRSFDHGGVHFVLINAQALNSGLAHEDEQSKWLEADLEEKKGERIHMFSHYPPYILDPSEPSNYDNLDEPARSWLLKLLKRYGVEALFAGHAHQFFYQKHDTTDIYNVFSTSFVRQDYSEMFRIEAAEEYGRNDAEKLGWCIVDVYEDTHVARMFRSHGHILMKGEKALSEAPKVNVYHTIDGLVSFLGVHLRHPWTEIVELPYNGPVDEFVRKRVRNDYTLLGLWECGIRKLRIPLSDLMDERTRNRIRTTTKIGHRFTFFSVGIPTGLELETLRKYRDVVDAVEIILPWRDASDATDELLSFQGVASVPVFLANIESSVDRRREGPKFSHYVGYGFRIHDTDRLDDFLNITGAAGVSDGFVFQVGADESPLDTIQAIGDYAERWGFRAHTNVRLASEDPSEYLNDDLRVANRVAESVVGVAAATKMDVFLDTFMDIDRGYFPRVGIYDRRLNPRMGSHVLAHLQSVLNDYGPEITFSDRWETAGWNSFTFETSKTVFNMFLPSSDILQEPRIPPSLRTAVHEKRTARIVNLVSGMISEVTLGKDERELAIEDKDALGVPLLCLYEK